MQTGAPGRRFALWLIESVALERTHQVVEGLAVGLVQAHQDTVGFEHLAAHHLLGLVLGRQIGRQSEHGTG